MADELVDLQARLKRLEWRHSHAVVDADRAQRQLVARVFVLVATAALLLAVSMTWYADAGNPGGPASGWRFFSLLAADKGGLAVVGTYSLIVVAAALVAGVSVFAINRPWVAVTVSSLLALLIVLHLAVSAQARLPVETDGRLAGSWCSIIVMAVGAAAWGNLARSLSHENSAG